MELTAKQNRVVKKPMDYYKIKIIEAYRKNKNAMYVEKCAKMLIEQDIKAKKQADFIKEYYEENRLVRLYGMNEGDFFKKVMAATDRILRSDLYE